ncbi:hypothetical protein DL96DRAFT_1583588 [Flagelloscypha sp. PMI_526]|nr:hypothetical protein DL96DRAFT_1583588 [Flagelloscypha sp. PMI_526]
MTWSTQPDFQLRPFPRVDGSLLVVGNRTGSLCFLRYDRVSNKPILVHLEQVCESWLTRVAMSDWRPVESSLCEATVAVADAEGNVGLVIVTQRLNGNKTIDVSVNLCNSLFQGNHCGITSLQWHDSCSHPFLSFTTPGRLYLHVHISSSSSPLTEVPIPRVGLAPHGSPFQTPSNIHYLPDFDALLVLMFDGSCLVLKNVFSPTYHPTWGQVPSVDLEGCNGPEGVGARVRRYTLGRRSWLNHAAPESVRITGMVPFDRNGLVVWAHEVICPGEFDYRYDSESFAQVSVGQLWESREDPEFLKQIEELVNLPCAVSDAPTSSLLRPILPQLFERLDLAHEVLRLLAQDMEEEPALIKVQLEQTDSTILPRDFRQSLRDHLFGSQQLLALRLKLNICVSLWKFEDDEETRRLFLPAVSAIKDKLAQNILAIFLAHIEAITHFLTTSPVSSIFVLRLLRKFSQTFNLSAFSSAQGRPYGKKNLRTSVPLAAKVFT